MAGVCVFVAKQSNLGKSTLMIYTVKTYSIKPWASVENERRSGLID